MEAEFAVLQVSGSNPVVTTALVMQVQCKSYSYFSVAMKKKMTIHADVQKFILAYGCRSPYGKEGMTGGQSRELADVNFCCT